MKRTLKFALVSAFLAATPAVIAADSEKSCKNIQAAVEKAVKADEAKVLEIVEAKASANSGCACEVVKAAIIATEADKDLVRQIVEVAIVAAPDEMRLIAQCAVAVAPDSVGEVQKVLASFDPQSGESSGSSKGGLSKGGLSKGGLDKGGAVEPIEIKDPLDGVLTERWDFEQPENPTPDDLSPVDDEGGSSDSNDSGGTNGGSDIEKEL